MMWSYPAMNKPFNPPFQPNTTHVMVRWSDLETAWRMLAAPDKESRITETVDAVRALSLSATSEKAVFTMIAATAWLTDDGPASKEDWQP